MGICKKIVFMLTLSVLFSTPAFLETNVQAAVGRWEIFELTLSTTNTYDNPYTEVTLTATFTSPSSSTIQIPGFWDGDQDGTIHLEDLLIQLGRNDLIPLLNNAPVNVADGESLYMDVQADRTYTKPVVNAEFGYDAYDGWNNREGRTTPDTVRRLA